MRGTNDGGESDWANTNAKTQDKPVVLPPKPTPPTGLAANPSSSTQINLAWNDLPTETKYDLQISKNANFSDNLPLITILANKTDYSATMLDPSTTYYFRLRGTNDGGEGEWANANAKTQDKPVVLPTKPNAPIGLAATPISSTQINLAWNDLPTETKYDLQISKNANFSDNPALITILANKTDHSAAMLDPSTTYYFRLRGTNDGGDGDWATANAKTQDKPVVLPPKPNAPIGLAATPSSSTQINLAWTDLPTETKYDLQISKNANFSDNLPLITILANKTDHSATMLDPSTTYYFRLRGTNDGGEGEWANANAKTQDKPVINTGLKAPTALRQKTGTPAINQISLVWDDAATDVGYEISRATDTQTTWTILKGDIAANTKNYDDKPVRAGTKYFYRVRSAKGTEFSPYSNILEINAPLVSSVSNSNWPDLQVYPNPFSHYLTLNRTQEKIGSVEIIGISGAVIKTWLKPTTDTFDVADLPIGVYFFRVNQASQSKSFKIIKQ